MIWMSEILIFPSYNPKNMLRTSPYVLIRSGGPGLGILMKAHCVAGRLQEEKKKSVKMQQQQKDRKKCN